MYNQDYQIAFNAFMTSIPIHAVVSAMCMLYYAKHQQEVFTTDFNLLNYLFDRCIFTSTLSICLTL